MKRVLCYECGKEVEVFKKVVTNTYVIRGENVVIDEEIDVCKNCGQEVALNEEDLSLQMYKINNAYLKSHNLSFKIIKDLRIKLGLSQGEFAKKLGWSKKTIVRYENGQSLPQGEYLKFYEKLALDINYFYERTGICKDKFIENNTKGINAILYMLTDNSLCMTAIMKNLFGVDFYALNKYNKQVTNFEYAKLPYGPVINGYKDLIDLMLFKELIDWDIDIDGNVVYTANKLYNSKLFTKEEFECLKFIKNKMFGKTAKELSDWSHEFLGWKETEIGEIIDNKYAKDIKFDNI